VTVAVYDSANPEQKAYTNLTLSIKRNENKPRFIKYDYTANILEIAAVGTVIAQVGSAVSHDIIVINSNENINLVGLC